MKTRQKRSAAPDEQYSAAGFCLLLFLSRKGEREMKEKNSQPDSIAAVSGGPDSMAMLGLLLEEGKRPVVAHVNYHARETARRDEDLVRSFCEKNGLVFEKRDVKHKAADGNFQAWAREVRYAFFEELAAKYGCRLLYVGHQKDDCIETWLLQKERGLLPQWYGLPAKNRRKNLRIERPVLSMTKKDCENWCESHGVSWGLDESNLESHYRRNQIRHMLVDGMSDEQKDELIRQIEKDNEDLKSRREQAVSVLRFCQTNTEESQPADLSPILQEENAWFILDLLLSGLIGRHLSAREARELVSQLRNSPCHFFIQDKKGKPLILERYGNRLTLQREPEPVFWRFGSLPVLEQMARKNPAREALIRKKEEGDPLIDCVWLKEEDFPLTLRTARSSDVLKLRFGSKKLQRHFIDRKMNRAERKRVLVLENRQGEIIFASSLGCDVNHFENGTPFCLHR